MNIIEAIKAAKAGLKVKYKGWPRGDYIFIPLNSKLILRNETNWGGNKIATFYAHDFLSDEWEILEDRC